MRQILDYICEDWNALKNSEEVEIAQKYGKFTKRITMILFRKKSFKIDFLDINEWVSLSLIFTSTLLKAVHVV